MLFRGKLWKEGRHWLAELPLLDAMTQGHSRKEVLLMVEDLLESLVGSSEFRAHASVTDDGRLYVRGSDSRLLIALLLRRQRSRSGLTLTQVSERLGARSRNAYARYEQGTSQPTLEKLSELLQAVAPDRELVLDQND